MKKTFLLFTIFSLLFIGCKEECDCFSLNEDNTLSGTSWERISYGKIDSVDVSRETNVEYVDLGKEAMWEELLVFGNPDYIYTSKLYINEQKRKPGEPGFGGNEYELRNDDFGFRGQYTYKFSVLNLFSANSESILTGKLDEDDSERLIFVDESEYTQIFDKVIKEQP